MQKNELMQWLCHPTFVAAVQQQWQVTDELFRRVQAAIPPEHRMSRMELSFHEDTKLLGFLTLLTQDLSGDVLEIGVWKGKTLACLQAMVAEGRKVVGIDPLELPNQSNELAYYHRMIYPKATVIEAYSERAVEAFERCSSSISVLHIDGGHLARHVMLDFLLYEPYVVSGGFVLFDDYRDFTHSPEVGPAVDLLRVGGLFSSYEIHGSIPGYENSYLLQKR